MAQTNTTTSVATNVTALAVFDSIFYSNAPAVQATVIFTGGLAALTASVIFGFIYFVLSRADSIFELAKIKSVLVISLISSQALYFSIHACSINNYTSVILAQINIVLYSIVEIIFIVTNYAFCRSVFKYTVSKLTGIIIITFVFVALAACVTKAFVLGSADSNGFISSQNFSNVAIANVVTGIIVLALNVLFIATYILYAFGSYNELVDDGKNIEPETLNRNRIISKFGFFTAVVNMATMCAVIGLPFYQNSTNGSAAGNALLFMLIDFGFFVAAISFVLAKMSYAS
ncbi:hypothetical protein HK100_004237 [Physocladia obscura]|uniref:Uncharacterized protein n=1 Tax=Physocladia obscura TaxID=109957 RepID=A0AAD5X8W2_9FUNG|nr:hypothetical protein HK100_004237 [Physocladia obscura]